MQHQIAVQADDVLPAQQIPRQIHAVNIVRLPILRIMDEVEADAAVQRFQIRYQRVRQMPRRHHRFRHADAPQQFHLPRDDGFLFGQAAHALGMLPRFVAHARPQPRIEQQCNHAFSSRKNAISASRFWMGVVVGRPKSARAPTAQATSSIVS